MVLVLVLEFRRPQSMECHCVSLHDCALSVFSLLISGGNIGDRELTRPMLPDKTNTGAQLCSWQC